MAITAASLLVKVGADTGGAEAGLGRVAGLMGKTLVVGAVAGVAAVAGIGIAAIKMAGDFQQGMTTLVTGAGESQANIKMVSDGILQLAVDSGTSTQQLTAGMFMIESGGYRGAAGLNVLKVAAEGAKVGNADLGTTATAVGGIMNDYAAEHITAAQAMNILTATVQNGLTHMQDLAGAMPQVLSTAQAAGVGITDVAAAMATMTSETVPAAQASTYLRQTIIALDAPSKGAQKAMESFGLSSSAVAAEMKKSLPDALKMITDAVGKKFPVGSAQYVAAIKDIAGGSKQMQGILDLTGTHMQTFAGNATSISDKAKGAGNSIMGWSDVQGDFNFKIDKAKEVVETFMIKLGTGLLPIAGRLVDMFTNNVLPILNNFASFISANVGPALDGVGGILTTTVLPILQGFGTILTGTLLPALKKAWDAIEPTLLPALRSLGTFITGTIVPAAQQFAKFFATSVVPALSQLAVFITTAVIPAAEKLATFITKNVIPIFEQVEAIILKDVLPVLESIFKSIMTEVVPSLEKIWNIVAPKLIPVLQFLGAVFKNVIGPAIGFAIGFIGNLIGAVATVIGWVFGFLDVLGKVGGFIKGTFSAAINGITTVFSNVFGGLWGIVKAPLNAIIGGVNAIISALDTLHVSIPSWVPVVGGQNWGINIPQIPLLAQGGQITQTGYAVVGDAGPELLKLPTGAKVAPLSTSSAINGLPSGMHSAAGGAAASGAPQPIVVQIGTQQLMKILLPAIATAVRTQAAVRHM